jgi:site-specific DNA recombinase
MATFGPVKASPAGRRRAQALAVGRLATEGARLEAARAEGRKVLAAQLRAGIYTRISLAGMGDTTKTDDQERISRELAARLGLDVADVYCDPNRSAWRRDRKRPEWERMLADVQSGRLGALIVYHGDRLIRQPRDLEDLIDLAESRGIRLFSPNGTRNLDNADDRYILRIDVAAACRASDDTSRRKKAQLERWRRQGRTRSGGRGGRAFGFAADGVTQAPAEADAVREMAARLLAGETMGTVLRALAADGVTTTAGGQWSHRAAKRMLLAPRTAGLMPDGETQAAWEPLLERGTWERLRLVLAGRTAPGAPRAARSWMLSNIAVCGVCGSPLRGQPRTSQADAYSCKRASHVSRSRAVLDAYVLAAVAARVAVSPQGRAPERPGAAAEWAALEAEQAEAEAAAADYAGSAGRLRLILGRLDAIDARMAELRGQEAGQGRSRLLAEHAGKSAKELAALPLDVRRALVRAAVTVTVHPVGRGRGRGLEGIVTGRA